MRSVTTSITYQGFPQETRDEMKISEGSFPATSQSGLHEVGARIRKARLENLTPRLLTSTLDLLLRKRFDGKLGLVWEDRENGDVQITLYEESDK